MPKATGPTQNITNFDRGIVGVSSAKDSKQYALPQPAKNPPSEAKIDTQLTKLWEAKSLESLLHKTFVPLTVDLENLNPARYQKELKKAKELFLKKLKEKKAKMPNKRSSKKEQEQEQEIFEQIVKDLEELESLQDLLWMLRQVVHIA